MIELTHYYFCITCQSNKYQTELLLLGSLDYEDLPQTITIPYLNLV